MMLWSRSAQWRNGVAGSPGEVEFGVGVAAVGCSKEVSDRRWWKGVGVSRGAAYRAPEPIRHCNAGGIASDLGAREGGGRLRAQQGDFNAGSNHIGGPGRGMPAGRTVTPFCAILISLSFTLDFLYSLKADDVLPYPHVVHLLMFAGCPYRRGLSRSDRGTVAELCGYFSMFTCSYAAVFGLFKTPRTVPVGLALVQLFVFLHWRLHCHGPLHPIALNYPGLALVPNRCCGALEDYPKVIIKKNRWWCGAGCWRGERSNGWVGEGGWGYCPWVCHSTILPLRLLELCVFSQRRCGFRDSQGVRGWWGVFFVVLARLVGEGGGRPLCAVGAPRVRQVLGYPQLLRNLICHTIACLGSRLVRGCSSKEERPYDSYDVRKRDVDILSI
ncbi:hypothetical protein Tco_0705846 [Tanacetum coccineum]|uniref:Uncharacterized protein n=1 Tax=Tanacetum coccineum TaxID=301880 RepID=A0ABQ4Y5R3_9ASTR